MGLFPFCDTHIPTDGLGFSYGRELLRGIAGAGSERSARLAPDFARLCDYLGRPEVAL